jgi:two-component system nitrogen regulation response regulator GlnG
LRERREDIPVLVRHFLLRSAQELGVDAKRLTEAALRHLQLNEFPGNVRQLENLCHWLTVMAPGQMVDVADLPSDMRDALALSGGSGASSAQDWLAALNDEADRLLHAVPGEVFDQLSRAFEKALILRALATTGGRRVEAAQILGIGRNTITRKIQELGIDAVKGDD